MPIQMPFLPVFATSDVFFDVFAPSDMSGVFVGSPQGMYLLAQQQFRVPTLFASPPRSIGGGGSTGDLPPAGDGGRSGGPKDGSAVDDLVMAFRALLPEIKTATELVEIVDEDIGAIGSKADRLRYIGRIGTMLVAEDGITATLGFEPLLRAAHFITMKADAFMDHITAQGRSEDLGTDEHDVLDPLMFLANRMELELVDTGELTYELFQMAADVYAVQASKGQYSRILSSERKNRLAWALLELSIFDIFNRYNVARKPGEAHRVLSFLMAALDHNRREPSGLKSAQDVIVKEAERDIMRYIGGTGNVESIDKQMLGSGRPWGKALRIYTFSPSILEQLAERFQKRGIDRLAAIYRAIQAATRDTALRLNLIA